MARVRVNGVQHETEPAGEEREGGGRETEVANAVVVGAEVESCSGRVDDEDRKEMIQQRLTQVVPCSAAIAARERMREGRAGDGVSVLRPSRVDRESKAEGRNQQPLPRPSGIDRLEESRQELT